MTAVSNIKLDSTSQRVLVCGKKFLKIKSKNEATIPKKKKISEMVPVHCFKLLPVTLTGLYSQVNIASTIKNAVAKFKGVSLSFIIFFFG